jgi:hypothetical protein
MADVKPAEDRDWILPAILVGAIVALATVAVIVLAVQASDEQEDTIAGQLETWSSCLRSEGANVPLVETLRGGGFRITVDDSLVEDGIDESTFLPALDECQAQAPEGVQNLMEFVDGISEFPLGSFEMLEEFDIFEDYDEFGELDDFGFLGEKRRPTGPRIERQLERFDISEVCELIEDGEIDPSSVPRRLLRACP